MVLFFVTRYNTLNASILLNQIRETGFGIGSVGHSARCTRGTMRQTLLRKITGNGRQHPKTKKGHCFQRASVTGALRELTLTHPALSDSG